MPKGKKKKKKKRNTYEIIWIGASRRRKGRRNIARGPINTVVSVSWRRVRGQRRLLSCRLRRTGGGCCYTFAASLCRNGLSLGRRPDFGSLGERSVKLLLVSEKQVTPGKTAFTYGALERLFLGVRALVAFEMLEPGKRARTR